MGDGFTSDSLDEDLHANSKITIGKVGAMAKNLGILMTPKSMQLGNN